MGKIKDILSLIKIIKKNTSKIKTESIQKSDTLTPQTLNKNLTSIVLTGFFGKILLSLLSLFSIIEFINPIFNLFLEFIQLNLFFGVSLKQLIGFPLSIYFIYFSIIIIIIILFTFILASNNKRKIIKFVSILYIIFIIIIFIIGFVVLNPIQTERGINSGYKKISQNTKQNSLFTTFICLFNSNPSACILKQTNKKKNIVTAQENFKVTSVQNNRDFYFINGSKSPYYFYYKLKSSLNLTLKKIQCFSNENKAPFYTKNLNNFIINTRGQTISKQFKCENISSLNLNKPITITTELFYTIPTNFQQEIPIINCNSQIVQTYLQSQLIICQDLTLKDFSSLSGISSSWNPKGTNNAISLSTISFSSFFPLKYPITSSIQKQIIPLQISFENSFSNLGVLQSGKINKIELPPSLKQINSFQKDKLISNNKILYLTLNLNQKDIKGINLQPFSIEHINIQTITTLSKIGSFYQITFNDTSKT